MAIGEKRVARLMRQAGLVSIYAKERKGSTTRAKEHPLAPDLVGRDFAVAGPDRLWVADFTQLTTWQGTCYIAVIADAYSRLCLGWSVRTDKTVELVLEALDMAIWRRGQMRAAGAIHHSDQGSQYTAFAFTRRLAAEAIVASMGTVGDALDNAMCESLIGTMKIEKLDGQPWRSVEDVRAAVFNWIETWVQPPAPPLQPRLPLTPRMRKPTPRRTPHHQPLTCPPKRGNFTTPPPTRTADRPPDRPHSGRCHAPIRSRSTILGRRRRRHN
jgi:putative transposase